MRSKRIMMGIFLFCFLLFFFHPLYSGKKLKTAWKVIKTVVRVGKRIAPVVRYVSFAHDAYTLYKSLSDSRSGSSRSYSSSSSYYTSSSRTSNASANLNFTVTSKPSLPSNRLKSSRSVLPRDIESKRRPANLNLLSRRERMLYYQRKLDASPNNQEYTQKKLEAYYNY